MSAFISLQAIVSPQDAVGWAGLVYTCPDSPGISRRRVGKGFTYRGPDGDRVGDRERLKQINALAIPPAWTAVWICPDPDGHLQAIGRDEKGRRQYRYHARFRELRDAVKYERMLAFAEALPGLRRRVSRDMAAPGLGRRKILATVVQLLETTLIRVGNAAYARENRSYGLTTLMNRHVAVDGAELRFHFKGKSGKEWNLNIRNRRVAAIIKSCQELPGQHLFQYIDEAGERQAVTSDDVNAYLRDVSGADITAKDFRTWSGTVLAAMALAEGEPAAAGGAAKARRNVTRAIEQVAARLGNTPAICRKCYVHPEIVNAYLAGELWLEPELADGVAEDPGSLRPEEAAVLAFLESRNTLESAVPALASPPPYLVGMAREPAQHVAQ